MKKNQVDKAVLQLLTKVREKKEAIKASEKRPKWVTNCTLSTNEVDTVHSRVNIQTIRDTDKLLKIAAFLLQKDKNTAEAAQQLGLPHSTQYMGYKTSEWMTDLQTRVKMLQIEEQKKELDALNQRVDKLVTAEQRREMELLELQQLLDE